MPQPQIVNPRQQSPYESPWTPENRFLRVLWEFCWFVFCSWTPKPLNEWRLFWLRVFDAKIDGTPFVHQRARIAIPWNLTLHDRACLGDRANAYRLGEIEIGARATVAQEVYLSSASHDFTDPACRWLPPKSRLARTLSSAPALLSCRVCGLARARSSVPVRS